MYGKLVTGATFALLLAAPAMAATPAPAALSQVKATAAASSSIKKKSMHHVSGKHVRGKKITMISPKSEHGEVHALNALEAAGYRQFVNLHEKGADFVGTAQKAGKIYDVTVMPSGSIKATLA